mmetsp:Transcript_30332/g.85560  ORF Transcript_30332/g.85560 Transcript_30332/m.85560 type:complete len:224 (-) Transcript_30332:486-1157(-)
MVAGQAPVPPQHPRSPVSLPSSSSRSSPWARPAPPGARSAAPRPRVRGGCRRPRCWLCWTWIGHRALHRCCEPSCGWRGRRTSGRAPSSSATAGASPPPSARPHSAGAPSPRPGPAWQPPHGPSRWPPVSSGGRRASLSYGAPAPAVLRSWGRLQPSPCRRPSACVGVAHRVHSPRCTSRGTAGAATPRQIPHQLRLQGQRGHRRVCRAAFRYAAAAGRQTAR